MRGADPSWIKVKFDEKEFKVQYEKPGEDNWTKTFFWKDIIKICFESFDYGATDFLHIFFGNRDDECIIPIEENDSGEEFWKEIKRRKLFDLRYAIRAGTRSHEYHCWPRD